MTLIAAYPKQRLLRRLTHFSFPARPAPGAHILLTPPRKAAVLVLFGMNEKSQLDVLLTRRAATMTHHPSETAFPGGGVESVDNNFFSRAALREAQEEIGLAPDQVTLLSIHEATWVPASNNLVAPVLAWWDEPNTDTLTADPAEVESIMRVPLEAFKSPSTHITLNGQPAFRLGSTQNKVLVSGLAATIMHAAVNAGL